MEHYEDHDGINRNIVECKDVNSNTVTILSLVLIETLWNVKGGVFEHELSWQSLY